MTLTAQTLQGLVASHGRYLWHATDEDCAAAILEEGLRPGVEGAAPTRYVSFGAKAIAGGVRGDAVFVRVDLLALDPRRFEPDLDGLLTVEMVIEDGLLGLNNAGHPTSHVDEAARWVTKDHYFLRQPFSPEATMAAFERYPSFAYRGSVPVGALAPN